MVHGSVVNGFLADASDSPIRSTCTSFALVRFVKSGINQGRYHINSGSLSAVTSVAS